MAVQLVRYAAPGWGVGEVWLEGVRVLEATHPHPSNSLLHDRDPLADRLGAWFDGARDDFRDVELELGWCSPFQRSVLETLRAIPYGETVTYGELAALAGSPGAQRAAGTFCARNRFAVIVPCHRVVAAGGLGSYGSLGVGYKRRLLELERYASGLAGEPAASIEPLLRKRRT
jgi:methylated-DNA-[protein]-cysteine S-methyltransferase